MLTFQCFVFNIFTGCNSYLFSLLSSLSLITARTVFPIRGGKGNNCFYSAKTFCPFFCSILFSQKNQAALPCQRYPEEPFSYGSSPPACPAKSSMNPALFIAAAKVTGFLILTKLSKPFFKLFPICSSGSFRLSKPAGRQFINCHQTPSSHLLNEPALLAAANLTAFLVPANYFSAFFSSNLHVLGQCTEGQF